jgi:hypothetical protein
MTSPRFLLLCLALLAGLGCGGTATVTGNVTYGGKPVERGRISFLPLDDKGELDAKSPVIGTDIAQGKYKVTEVPRGKKQVAFSVAEVKGTEPPFEIANNQPIDITEANQTANFEVKKPDKSTPDNKK